MITSTELELKLSNTKIPTFVRNEGIKAVVRLNMQCYDHIITDRKTLHLLAEAIGVKPLKSGKYTFIRVFDELQNAVDIQYDNGYPFVFGEDKNP
jgi:hypothetical protein